MTNSNKIFIVLFLLIVSSFGKPRQLDSEDRTVTDLANVSSNSNSSNISDNSNETNETNTTTDSNTTNISSSSENQNASNKSISNITLMKLDDKIQILGQNCHKYIIDKEYKAVYLELSNLTNIDHILVSERDEDFSDCNQNSFLGCSNKTIFCIYEDNIKNQVDLKIQHCSPKLYLYIYINSTNLSDSESYGTIKVDEEEDEEICSDMEKEDWDYCTNLTIEQCTSNDTKVCKDCKWVQCNYAQGNFAMCIPEDIEVSNKTNDICMTNIDFNLSTTKSVDYKYCGLALNTDEASVFKKVGKTLSIVLLAVIVIIIISVFFALSVCWYRWKLNNSKVPPFTPPACCPECLFPRPPNPVAYSEEQGLEEGLYQEIKENK